MVTPPSDVPSGRPAVLALTVSVSPPAGTVPDDGVTVSQGSVGGAVKLWPASAASSRIPYFSVTGESGDAAPSLLFCGRMETPTTVENDPGSVLQRLIPRTR